MSGCEDDSWVRTQGPTTASQTAGGVCSPGSVKNIVMLNERRIALTEPTIRPQSHDQLTLASAFHIIDQTLEER
jgi:hypothetical protein